MADDTNIIADGGVIYDVPHLPLIMMNAITAKLFEKGVFSAEDMRDVDMAVAEASKRFMDASKK